VIYADNDAVNQTQQLVKLIQDAIIVEPVVTGMHQVARAAVAAGIGWGLLNRAPEYLSELRRDERAFAFAVTTNKKRSEGFRESNWELWQSRATFCMSRALLAVLLRNFVQKGCSQPNRKGWSQK
jgi:hypothetical protein